MSAPRMWVVGRLHIGSNPWFDCAWCGTVRDTGEFDVCPVCLEELAERERRHWVAIKHDALAAMSTETETTH